MFDDEYSHQRLYTVVKTCASLPEVRTEVMKNHDDNLWWPLAITDWRLRLIVAGWSTRVSYHMIATYRDVVMRAHTRGYEQLCALPDEELAALVGPLGLAHARVMYLRSVQQFLHSTAISEAALEGMENDALVELFAQYVHGAGYKVAQCAILYAKGYHCGILPIDSGMKDLLGPCLGFNLPAGRRAHEVMRRYLEQIIRTHSQDYSTLAASLGYGDLSLPQDRPPIWWVHLTLIYFKRRYCNVAHPDLCPLREDTSLGLTLGAMCSRSHPQQGIWHDVGAATLT